MSAFNRWATGREALSQPDVWRKWAPELTEQARNIRSWIADRGPSEIWLCGAGTSAYIGEALEPRASARPMRAVASTDLVAAPYAYFRFGARVLVVSFGRSGNSSESLGTMDLLDNFHPEADRLNITCNADSALATRLGKGPGEGRAILLPASTHDAGFAMTVSFSTMLYTALACLGTENRLAEMAQVAQAAIDCGLQSFGLVTVPERIVFLGSGPLRAAARESCLKIMELTKGRVATLWETPMGFRHGPKSFLAKDTRVVVFKSAHSLTRAYDDDVVSELRAQFPDVQVTSIGGTGSGADVTLPLTDDDSWNVPVFVIPAQLAGVAWADALGINVDNPFAGEGSLTRVVSGVRLYTDRSW